MVNGELLIVRGDLKVQKRPLLTCFNGLLALAVNSNAAIVR